MGHSLAAAAGVWQTARLGGGCRMLVGRGDELAVLESLLRGQDGGEDRFVLVEGPAGIGKTTLLRGFCGRARTAGFAVAASSADRLEMDFAFGVVRQLFEPM